MAPDAPTTPTVRSEGSWSPKRLFMLGAKTVAAMWERDANSPQERYKAR